MLNDTDTIQHYPLRHPDNKNLHLHHDDTFEGFQLMRDKGPFIRESLAALKHTIDLALADYPRVLAFRLDLYVPKKIKLPDYAHTNKVITKFFESFTKKIKYHQNQVAERGYSRGCKVRYVWSREIGQGGRLHYHLLILLNRDAYYKLGLLRSERINMFRRIEESWASALGLSVDQARGLVNRPPNPEYFINRAIRQDKVDEMPEMFKRASYLCKKATLNS